jgi:hypothetical protein
MAKLLQEIEWESPLLGADTGTGFMTELSRLSPWIGTTIASFSEPMKFSHATARHMGIAYFVTSQENACRYCYGVARATMQIWGYSEKQIQDLEHQATLADGITRMVVEFARKLAKSNPTPAREDREALIAAGLNPEAAPEIAACVAEACFANRIATFLALPPNLAVEKIPTSLPVRARRRLSQSNGTGTDEPEPLQRASGENRRPLLLAGPCHGGRRRRQPGASRPVHGGGG